MSNKDKNTALILAILLGYLGIHRFYVGKTGSGILYLFTGGLFGIGWIIDIILIATDKFTDKNGNLLTRNIITTSQTQYNIENINGEPVIYNTQSTQDPIDDVLQKFKNIKTWQKVVSVIVILIIISVIVSAFSGSPDENIEVSTESSITSTDETSLKEDTAESQIDSSVAESSIEESTQESSDIENSIEESAQVSSVIENSVQSTQQAKTLKEFTFIVNTDSGKFHIYECQAAKKLNDENRKEITITAYSSLEAQEQMKANGYDLCGICGR